MLTTAALDAMEPGEQFASGTFRGLAAQQFHPYRRIEPIRFVAVRGQGYGDWAVYLGIEMDSVEEVARSGDKMGKTDALKLVEADEDAAARYRR